MSRINHRSSARVHKARIFLLVLSTAYALLMVSNLRLLKAVNVTSLMYSVTGYCNLDDVELNAKDYMENVDMRQKVMISSKLLVMPDYKLMYFLSFYFILFYNL